MKTTIKGTRHGVRLAAAAVFALAAAGCRVCDVKCGCGKTSADNAPSKEACASDCTSGKQMQLDLEIARDGKAITKTTIFTRDGEPGFYKNVTEYVYPKQYNVQIVPSNGVFCAVVEPEEFVERDVGVTASMTPRLDGAAVNLGMRLEVVGEPTWKNYGWTITAPDGSKNDMPMEQPFFPLLCGIEATWKIPLGKPATFQSDGLTITITPSVCPCE